MRKSEIFFLILGLSFLTLGFFIIPYYSVVILGISYGSEGLIQVFQTFLISLMFCFIGIYILINSDIL